MGKHVKEIVGFGVLAIVSYLLAIPYLLQASSSILTMLEKKAHSPISATQYLVANGVSLVIYVIFFSLIGIALAKRTGLKYKALQKLFDGKKPSFEKNGILLSVGWGIIGSILVVLVSAVLNKHLNLTIPNMSHAVSIARWKGLLSMFQGGLSEEVMLRFGLMTLLVWLIKLICKQKEHIASWIYIVAIILSSVVFGLGHLPLAASVFGGLSGWILTYILVGNGLMGLGFGYLYWKEGLEYAIIAHIIGDFMLHVVF